VLTRGGEDTSFEIFTPERHPWLAGVRRDTYRDLLPEPRDLAALP
jgi:hypothetical protein